MHTKAMHVPVMFCLKASHLRCCRCLPPAWTGPLGSFQPRRRAMLRYRGELEDEELFGYQLCPFRTSSNVLTDGFLIVFQGGLQKTPAAGGGKQTRDLKGREWQNRKISKTFFSCQTLSRPIEGAVGKDR